MNVFLVHGMARTPLSMWPLASAARLEGARVTNFGYTATFETVDHIVGRLARRLGAVTVTGPTIAVGHSLGGVLLRLALSRLPEGTPAPARLILVASPNQPSRIAHKLRDFLPFRLLNGDAGRMLGDDTRMAVVPLPSVPCTLVLGTAGSQGSWTPFPGESNDGLVAATEARLHCGEEVIEAPSMHSFVMRHQDVRALLRHAVRSLAQDTGP